MQLKNTIAINEDLCFQFEDRLLIFARGMGDNAPFGSWYVCRGDEVTGCHPLDTSTDGLMAMADALGLHSGEMPEGYALAMRVLQSDLFHQLDPVERAECIEFIHRGQARL